MAKEQYRINVYSNGGVVARVRYNSNLDFWDGRNWSNGGTGMHKGLTKLKTGEYVLIVGTQWQGERDHGEIISADHALQEILRSGNLELLNTKKFKALKELAENKGLLGESEEEDE